MLGLVALEHELHPHSTVDKVIFLIENGLTHAHLTTTSISFIALLVLVFLRAFKNIFKKYWWIYRLPEVFIVVVVSTCASILLQLFGMMVHSTLGILSPFG
jgi:MFS superfamily sulfate permease-like transporter